MTSFSLRSLRLRPGEEHRDEQEIALEPISLGGQRYLPVPENVPAELAVSRAQSGTVLELRFHTRLHGPCRRVWKRSSKTVPDWARLTTSSPCTLSGTDR